MNDAIETKARLLTYRQVAAYLQVSERSVYQLVKDGKLRVVRFGSPSIRRIFTTTAREIG